MSFPAFICAQMTAAGNQMYIDTSTGLFYDTVTGAQVDPETGALSSSPDVTVFSSRGGDGGITIPQGNGAGYCPSFGYAVADSRALTVQTAPGSLTAYHFVGAFGHNVEYAYWLGLKIDAATGYPVDPWNCELMAPYLVSNPVGDLWVTSKSCGGQHVLFHALDGAFYDSTYTSIDPLTCNPLSYPHAPTVFQNAGGDGGVSTFPVGAVGPQVGSVGGYQWPDANNPALTPAGCDMSGPDIPARRILLTPSPRLTDTTIRFSPKDNFLKALNTLLDSISYWPLYDDEAGNLCSSPMPFSSGVVPQADRNFIYTTGPDGVIAPGVIQKINPQNAIANKVIVRSDNAKRAAIVAVSYNRSDRSFISVQNLGRVIQRQPIIQLDQITDQAILQERADIELNFAALGQESVEFTALINPFMGVHDVLGLNVYSPDGKTLEIGSTIDPFLVTGWSIDYATRLMKITCGKTVPL